MTTTTEALMLESLTALTYAQNVVIALLLLISLVVVIDFIRRIFMPFAR